MSAGMAAIEMALDGIYAIDVHAMAAQFYTNVAATCGMCLVSIDDLGGDIIRLTFAPESYVTSYRVPREDI